MYLSTKYINEKNQFLFNGMYDIADPSKQYIKITNNHKQYIISSKGTIACYNIDRDKRIIPKTASKLSCILFKDKIDSVITYLRNTSIGNLITLESSTIFKIHGIINIDRPELNLLIVRWDDSRLVINICGPQFLYSCSKENVYYLNDAEKGMVDDVAILVSKYMRLLNNAFKWTDILLSDIKKI